MLKRLSRSRAKSYLGATEEVAHARTSARQQLGSSRSPEMTDTAPNSPIARALHRMTP
jgi:hypothetical protein